jgi:Cft2 family RNA processing exonuclease
MNKKQEINEADIRKTCKNTALEIKEGTKLIRKYQGKKHEVIVIKKGFEYNGQVYKSLSAIANKITGTRWNGKIFFGVKK